MEKKWTKFPFFEIVWYNINERKNRKAGGSTRRGASSFCVGIPENLTSGPSGGPISVPTEMGERVPQEDFLRACLLRVRRELLDLRNVCPMVGSSVRHAPMAPLCKGGSPKGGGGLFPSGPVYTERFPIMSC